jgi:methyl-accepting chemotaxis protein
LSQSISDDGHVAPAGDSGAYAPRSGAGVRKTVLSRLSARAILDLVFLTLSIALCGALAVHLHGALQSVELGSRLTNLAEANRTIAHAMQNMRDKNSRALVTLQNSDEAAGVVAEAHARPFAILGDAVAAARRSLAPGVGSAVAAVEDNWSKLDDEWKAMEVLATKPRAERDAAALLRWSRDASNFRVNLGRMSLAVNNEARMKDESVAELVFAAQLGWTAQDSSGLECVASRASIASSKPLSAEEHAVIDHLRGAADAALNVLGDTMARPEIEPALLDSYVKAKDAILKVRPVQTAKATEEIATQIGAIQASTREAVSAIEGISALIAKVSQFSSDIAAAVEEQNAATQQIARNAQAAMSSSAEVSANVAGVGEAADQAGNAASQVLAAVNAVTMQSDDLRRRVDTFLADIRAK